MENTKMKKGLITIQDLFSAGVHLGHESKDWNPKMLPYIHSIQNKRHIIDLEQSLPLLRRSMSFLKKISEEKGNILFVGTQNPEIAQITKITAELTNQSYITTRWVHGTLSNWKSVSKSIRELNEFEKRLNSIKETWSERKGREIPSISELLSSSFSPLVRRRYKRLKYLFDGVKNLEHLPTVLVILDDLNHHRLALHEAKRQQIAVVGILDSNTDPTNIQYPVPGNDDSLKSIHLYAKCFTIACLEGQSNV